MGRGGALQRFLSKRQRSIAPYSPSPPGEKVAEGRMRVNSGPECLQPEGDARRDTDSAQTKSPGTAPGLFNFLFRPVANQAWVAVGFLCSLLWAISMK